MAETSQIEPSSTTTLQERVQSLRLGREVRVPPRRSSLPFWITILVVLGGVGFWLFRTYGAEWAHVFSSAPNGTASSASTSNSTASGSDKEKVAGNIALEAGGYIVPMQKVQVSPKVGGQVKELYIE